MSSAGCGLRLGARSDQREHQHSWVVSLCGFLQDSDSELFLSSCSEAIPTIRYKRATLTLWFRLSVWTVPDPGTDRVWGNGRGVSARDTRLERTVAIKVLRNEISWNPNMVSRFEQEARSAASLNHPHVCAVYDVGRQDGIEYLVMEYLKGETLAERIEKQTITPDDAIIWGIQIAEALDQAHSMSLIHP